MALAGTALASSLEAQRPAPRPVRMEQSSFAPSAAATERRDQTLAMRKMLRLLTTAQEQHFARHSTYSNRLDELRATFRAAWDDTVDVRILHAGARAWSGVATHPSLPGRSCVIFVGPIAELPSVPRTAGGRAPSEEGVPVCDEG
jgi:hypothetical protein